MVNDEMQNDRDYNVVMCGDLDCKLCTAGRPGETVPNAASINQAYVVYTCESPNCSLCRGETDVLLDLFCPFNSIQDIKEMSRKINITGIEDETASSTQPDGNLAAPMIWPGERSNANQTRTMARNDGSAMLRELLQTSPGNLRNKAKETESDITQNLKLIDETCLMDLALELQVDKLSDLPELMHEGISEFI